MFISSRNVGVTRYVRMITLLLTQWFRVWGYVGGILLSVLAVCCNRTVSHRSFIYPLIPFDWILMAASFSPSMASSNTRNCQIRGRFGSSCSIIKENCSGIRTGGGGRLLFSAHHGDLSADYPFSDFPADVSGDAYISAADEQLIIRRNFSA